MEELQRYSKGISYDACLAQFQVSLNLKLQTLDFSRIFDRIFVFQDTTQDNPLHLVVMCPYSASGL